MGAFRVIVIIAVIISILLSCKKGYPILLMALLSFFFPIMAVVLFFLPDRNEMKKNAEETRLYKAAQTQTWTNCEEPQPEAGTMSPEAIYRRGVQFYHDKIYWQALRYFLIAAKQGHFQSQLMCAVMYDRGMDGTKDAEQALYWAEQAAQYGDINARRYYNVLYTEHKNRDTGNGSDLGLIKPLARSMALDTALGEE